LGASASKPKGTAAAQQYFEEALKLEPNGEYAPEAEQALAKLKKK
jgi:hypothetical protein